MNGDESVNEIASLSTRSGSKDGNFGMNAIGSSIRGEIAHLQ